MAFSPIDPLLLAARMGAWLQSDGPDGDVVVSFRVRLARNIAGRPFQARLDPDSAVEISGELQGVLLDASLDGETRWVPMAEGGPVLRQLLLERHLISRDLCPDSGSPPPGRAVAFGESETLSVMVNEEDHVRLQAMAAGFDPDLALQRARSLDGFLEARVPFAHSSQLGYLTGCPTNVGTGMRASVMLHLPALGMVRKELEKVFNAAQRTGLAVRGMQGEGSRAAGDLYQISNQVTLGRTEAQLVDDLRALVPEIVGFERNLRQLLMDEHPTTISDRVHRSLGLLQSARAMPTDGALAHISNLRLGVHLGLLDSPDPQTLSELGVQVQKGHVHALCAAETDSELLDVSERDKLRAGLLRSRLGR